MTSSILLFYLGGICDRALVISIFLFVVAVIVLCVFACLACGSSPEYTDEENKECKMKFRKLLKWPVIAVFLLGLFAMLVPSSRTMYVLSGVYASKYIVTETELGRTLNSEAVTVVKDIGKAIRAAKIRKTWSDKGAPKDE